MLQGRVLYHVHPKCSPNRHFPSSLGPSQRRQTFLTTRANLRYHDVHLHFHGHCCPGPLFVVQSWGRRCSLHCPNLKAYILPDRVLSKAAETNPCASIAFSLRMHVHVCASGSPHIRVAAGGQPQHLHSVFFETASLVAHCCIRRVSGPPVSRHPPVSVSHPPRGVQGPQTLDLRVHPCPSCVTEVAGSERRSLCLLENTQPTESSPLQFPPTF